MHLLSEKSTTELMNNNYLVPDLKEKENLQAARL